jgi:hypothetical protein
VTNTWARDTYRQNAAYVPALGAAVFELLNRRRASGSSTSDAARER